MTMHDIVKHHAISEIEGIVYRNRSGGILRNKKREVMSSINHLPHPAWDLYQLDRYDKILAIDVIRSCPFTCEYCFRGTGKTVRHKSPEIIAKEIRTNIDLFGIREFSFYGGGTFPLSKEHALTVCRNIVKEKLNIRWGASARIQLLDEMIIRMMALAGCTHMGIGIETGDARLLAKSGKQTSLDDIVIKLKLLKKYRIDAFVYFIIGFPGEDRVSIENTRRFISRLRPITTLANFAILTPFPGTPIYEKALMGKEGIRLATKDWTCYGKQAGKALLHENFSQEALKRLQLKLYLSYYLFSPSKIRTMLKLNKTLGTFSLKRFIELGKRFV
jgi:anaerobic magnesium-protoporphyrin IX monomethyl ester cyclase